MRALFLILSIPMLLKADSWAPVEIQTFASKNKDFVFLVVPAGYQDPKFPSLTTDPEIQRLLSLNKTCMGSLMKYYEHSGSYYPIWTKPLANKVSPVSAMISDDGKYVVTTGEWFGGGPEAIAIGIYNSNGKLIRSLTATDVLGEDRVNEAPSWGSVKAIDAESELLILEVWESGYGTPDHPFIFRERRMKLIDGHFIDED